MNNIVLMHGKSGCFIPHLLCVCVSVCLCVSACVCVCVEEFFLDSVYSVFGRRARIYTCIGVSCISPGGQIGFLFFVNFVANSRPTDTILSHDVDVGNSFRKNI